MNRSANEPLTKDVAREECRHAGNKAILTGSIGAWGKGDMLALRVLDCNTGNVLAKRRNEHPTRKRWSRPWTKRPSPSGEKWESHLARCRGTRCPWQGDHAIAGSLESLQHGA